MKRVYKYILSAEDYSTIVLPAGAQILSVHEQRDQIYLWVLIDPNEKGVETHKFRVAGTCHDITDEALRFIGSVLMYGGSLVFHVFEVPA